MNITGGKGAPMVTALVALVVLLTAVLPVAPVDWWWVRIWDFPRVQLVVVYLALGAVVAWRRPTGTRALAIFLLGAAAWQLSWIHPYLPVAPRETQAARSAGERSRLTLMTANVEQSNRSAGELIGLVQSVQPDVLVLLEIDTWWAGQLAPLGEAFAHVTLQPQQNTYGMAFYSNLPVRASDVTFRIEPGIPSIDAGIRLRSGQDVRLIALHPRPPRPGSGTGPRDAELVRVGHDVAMSRTPTVVLGDLNDVGWSPTTRLFQSVSRMLDPRKGRGIYPTFHAGYPLLRYPLDHLFHTDEFRLVDLQVLPAIGSDHFPLQVTLSYEPRAAAEQEAPR